MATRTQKRSSSRASVRCPVCDKRLSGEKGAVRHLVDTHSLTEAMVHATYGMRPRHK